MCIFSLTLLFSRIVEGNGYRIDHHYLNDHDPIHVHISGDQGQTKVDLNGNPLPGQRPMTVGERKIFWRYIDKIKDALKKFEITKEEYEMAYEEANKLMMLLEGKKEKLKSFTDMYLNYFKKLNFN